MREIKFRAWNGEAMHFGGFTIHAGGSIIGSVFINPEIVEVMQFTGLQDKSGVDIYEGDIVHICDTGQAWSVEYDDQEARFVVFNQLNSNRRFNTDFTDPECPIVRICEGVEFKPGVIGNIHQNPELLEQAK